ncbi:unnamed protein product [Acanthosepion pharaonis]|uniref:Uncharacterized protein n=1 Tax=Acanthosepion pharaonis TaxID=158019 RepID=A0A812CK20_ACAPH|nr:unnamed protein product [Sepia pharaonis]
MLVLLLSSFQLLTKVPSSIETYFFSFPSSSIANFQFPSSIETCLYYFFPLPIFPSSIETFFFPLSIANNSFLLQLDFSFLFPIANNSFLLQLRHACTTYFLFPIANNSFLLQLRHFPSSIETCLYYFFSSFQLLTTANETCFFSFSFPIANNSFLLHFLLQLRRASTTFPLSIANKSSIGHASTTSFPLSNCLRDMLFPSSIVLLLLLSLSNLLFLLQLLSSFQNNSFLLQITSTTSFLFPIAFLLSIETCLLFFPLSSTNNSFLLHSSSSFLFQLLTTVFSSITCLYYLSSFRLCPSSNTIYFFLFPIANNSFLLQLRHASTTSFFVSNYFFQLRRASTTSFLFQLLL